MRCPSCGLENLPEALYCDCGSTLSGPAPAERICPNCAVSTPPFAKYCWQCGHRFSQGFSTGRWVTIAALIIGPAILIAWLYSTPRPAGVVEGYSASASDRTETVTATDFEAVRVGMTYDEVAKLIGSPGEQLSQSTIGGTETTLYTWKNRNGSNMNAIFRNGQVISKAQAGLR